MRPRVFPAEDDVLSHDYEVVTIASMRPRVFPAEDAAAHRRPTRGTNASMRPRVFPAEDHVAQLHVRRAVRASMRPRVFPAEDCRAGLPSYPCRSGFNEAAGIPRGRRRPFRFHPLIRGDASMRPRVFPAEDDNAVANIFAGKTASMRPRVFPAEDTARYRDRNPRTRCFNEAAGIPRGRRDRRIPSHRGGVASMRPRVFPAEDSGRQSRGLRSTSSRFNEAAGIPRGRRPRGIGGSRPMLPTRFNEAAGIPRGRPGSARLPDSQHSASMRPRVFPAEDVKEFYRKSWQSRLLQ